MAPSRAAVQVWTINPGVTEAAILSMMALITMRNKPRVKMRQGESDDFQEQPKRGVYYPKDNGCDQRCNKAVQLKAGNNISDDQQRHGIDQPTDQNPHCVPSSPAMICLRDDCK